MARLPVIVVCGVGWLVVAAALAAPLAGMVLVATGSGTIATGMVAVPSGWVLLVRSLTLSAVATLVGLLLGLLPAGLLGSSRGPMTPVLLGLTLVPLLVPPQVYAYAWQLATSPQGVLGGILTCDVSSMWVGGAVRSGMISAGWLWPVVAMILAAGWRSTGQTVYSLAILDATPGRAYLRAVVPVLRPHLMAAAALVFALTLIEYAIPHLTLSRVYATELQVLLDVGAPPEQVMRMAAQVIVIVLVLAGVVAWSVRSTADWQSVDAADEADLRAGSPRWAVRTPAGRAAWGGSCLVWLGTVGLPIGVMAASLRSIRAWTEGFVLFAREWGVSLVVSLVAALLAAALAMGTAVLGRATAWRWLRIGSLTALLAALMPPAALGLGFVVVFNRAGTVGDVYTETPWVWILALVGRYGGIAVLIAWLAVGRRGIVAADQARTDGAGGAGVLAFVLLPMVWPSLLAAALIVVALSLFEVIVTQLVGPVGFPSIAMTILGHMHYGRDDVVITTSLTVVAAGVVLTQVCGRLLVRAKR